jgi:uncharacterized membrane protein YfcA
MKINIESDFHPLGNPKSESASAQFGITAAFLPLAILSTFAGVQLVKRVSPERFNIIIQLLMVVIGAELIRQAMW